VLWTRRLLLIACGLLIAAPAACADDAAAVSAAPDLHVRGNALYNGNQPFLVKGVIFEGFQDPAVTQSSCFDKNRQQQTGNTGGARVCARHLAAHYYYANAALSRARSQWHANTVRLNLNQAALDPSSDFAKALPTPYIDEVKAAVDLATQQGFAVILCAFSGENNEQGQIWWPDASGAMRRLGDVDDSPNLPEHAFGSYNPGLELPDTQTKRALTQLAKTFASYHNVLIETLNEPGGNTQDPTAPKDPMDQYLGGGGIPARGADKSAAGQALGPAVGVRELVRSVRENTGYTNPIIVEGIGTALGGGLAGVEQYKPGTNDNQIVYSTHPFLHDGSADDVNWTTRFGTFSKTHAVVLTAWQINDDGWCRPATKTAPVDFFNAVAGGYDGGAQGTNIGLVGYAFDVNNSIVDKFYDIDSRTFTTDTAAPSSGAPGACNPYGHGGVLLQSFFSAFDDTGSRTQVAAGTPGPAPAPGGGTTSASARPSLSAVKAGTLRAGKGGTITFILRGGQRGVVRFTFARRHLGTRVGKRCVAPPKHGKLKPCMRTVPLKGSLVLHAARDKNTYHWNGKLRGKRLKAGTYTLTAVVTTAKGRSRAVHITIRLRNRGALRVAAR
jgi:hypothetical protein